MKISCIVLNYNDADTTIGQIKRIRDYECLDFLVVVDNGSTDDSLIRLQALESESVIVLEAEGNKGYGAGNNVGLWYSLYKLHMTHAVIANPDAEFTQNCIEQLKKVFEAYKKAGVAAPRMEDDSGGNQPAAWRLLPFRLDLISAGPVSRRLFRRYLRYPLSYFKEKKAVCVDAVHGSMLMVDIQKMADIGGYDERVFLYCEENILGQRMRRAGFKTVLLNTCSFFHRNSTSISKTFESAARRQRLRHESTMFYYREYLKIGPVRQLFAVAFFRIIMFEIWFCGRILKMKR